jgi:hypothetical protein
MRLLSFLFLAAAAPWACGAAASAALSPGEILRRCDAARGNLGGVRWRVEVTDLSGGRNEARLIDVRARGFDMVAETLAPPRLKGHKLLLVRNSMWFHQPGLSKAVPVSLRQKLTGRAANGDIASTNYAEDYRILAVEDGEHAGEACHVFHLEAVSRSVTYARIRYWVSKERLVGVRADYFSASGEKLIKTAEMSYDHCVATGQGDRPFISEMRIRETLVSDDQTRLVFSPPELGEVPARLFRPESLAR